MGRGNIDPLILNLAPPALTAGKEALLPTDYETGCACEPIWTFLSRQKSLAITRIDPVIPNG